MLKVTLSKLVQVVILTLSLFTTVYSKEITNYKEMTFKDYVSLNCKKNCVNSDVALMTITDSAMKYNLDRKRLIAIMRVESSFRINAINVDSVGLMQINLKFHGNRFQGDFYNTIENIDIGASVYKKCVKKHKGDVMKSLKCYNGENGKGFVYSKKVLKAYDEITQLKDFH